MKQSCSWCHKENELTGGPVLCSECGHRADLPRFRCDCPQCHPENAAIWKPRTASLASQEYDRLLALCGWGKKGPGKDQVQGERYYNYWRFEDGSWLKWSEPYGRSLVPDFGVVEGLTVEEPKQVHYWDVNREDVEQCCLYCSEEEARQDAARDGAEVRKLTAFQAAVEIGYDLP